MTTVRFDALLDRVSDTFAERAMSEGIVDVAVTNIDTPVGPLLLAATEAGIVRVGFDIEGTDEVYAKLAETVSPRVLQSSNGLLAMARTQLEEYFAGTRGHFDLPLDLRMAKGPYRRAVLGLLSDIPLGETRTYAELAIESGRPNAVRAVGSGCANNPLPIIVPCHRVLRTGGQLGGYLGGVARKQWLLEHEQLMRSA